MTEPVTAEVPEPEVTATDGSSGAVAATPENSSSSRATEVVAVVTVTLVTGAAPPEYQSSPSELCPDWEEAPIRRHVLPAESVTAAMWLLAPVARLAVSTSRSPADDGVWRLYRARRGPGGLESVGAVGAVGVVTVTGAPCWDTLPEPSKASTV